MTEEKTTPEQDQEKFDAKRQALQKAISPIPEEFDPPQEETNERFSARYNINQAVEAETDEESIAFSLIAISITMHGLWEILNQVDISGKGTELALDRVADVLNDLAIKS